MTASAHAASTFSQGIAMHKRKRGAARKNHVTASTERAATAEDSAGKGDIADWSNWMQAGSGGIAHSIRSRHQLQYGQQWRIFLLECGARAQDLCVITLLKSL